MVVLQIDTRMKTRAELEAEAMRLIAAVNDNIVLDAKEVLVRALDQMQVDGIRSAAGIVEDEQRHYNEPENLAVLADVRKEILKALENR